MGSVLNSTYASNVDVSGLSGQAADAADSSIVVAQEVAGGLGPRGAELALSAGSAFVDGFHASLWLGAAALGIAAVVTLVFGPRAGAVDVEPDELDSVSGGTPARRLVPADLPLAASTR